MNVDEITTMAGLRALRGHTAVWLLMKRSVLVSTTLSPMEVEYRIDGPPPPELDQTGVETRPDGSQHAFTIPWTPENGEARGRYVQLFRKLAAEATGQAFGMQSASRSDLYRMAQRLVQIIGDHPSRVDWYPDGWREHYDLVARRAAE